MSRDGQANKEPATFLMAAPSPQRSKRDTLGRIAGKALQRIRRRHFNHYPLCVACERKGRVALAVELDHIVPLHKGGQDVEDNRQGLCKDCHAEKTRRDMGHKDRPEVGTDGFPK